MIQRWFLALCLLGCLVSPAAAQETGGSFGGGDWGGGGSDFGGGGSDFGGGGGGGGGSDWGGGGSDFGSGGSDWSSSGGGGGGAPNATLLVLLLLGAVGVFVVVVSGELRKHGRASGDHPYYLPSSASRAWNDVDITALRLGLDWRARKGVQARLQELARSGDTASKAGRVRLLRQTVALLEEARLSWLYADVVNHQPMNQAQAQGLFRGLAVDARARFQRELVRAADGEVTETEAGALRARSDEGPGVVVITLIVAARGELLDVLRERDAGQVQRLLDNLRSVTEQQLIALEVVWSPAAEDDRMSTAELEAKYPELARFSERTIGGRVFCEHCAGPFADELAECPHCGAPHARGETVTPG